MSRVHGSGSKQPVNNAQAANSRAGSGGAAIWKKASFITRQLKILGACCVALFALYFFRLPGLLLVIALLTGLLMLGQKTSGVPITIRGTIRTISAMISEFFGMMVTVGGILVLLVGLTQLTLFLSIAGSVMIVLGLFIWVRMYRSYP